MTDLTKNLSVEIRKLLRVLQQECELGRKQIAEGKLLTEALLGLDHGQVNEIQSRIEMIHRRQSELESERLIVARNVSLLTGIMSDCDNAIPPLSMLLNRLSSLEAKRLNAIRSDIIVTNTELKMVIERNSVLLRNAIEYVRYTMQYLSNATLQPAKYGINPNALIKPVFYLDQRC